MTAANSSSISDGAAAVVMTRASIAEKLGLPVAARVVAHAAHAQAPAEFTTAPVPAIEKALARAGWSAADVDLYEINEAFAVVAADRDARAGDPARRGSTSTAAPARSVTRSAPPARASWRRCLRRSRRATRSAGWRRSASAAARRVAMAVERMS